MNNEDKEEELKKEAEEFGDICRVSLLDSYEGLVHKVTKSISCLESYQGLVLIMDQPTFKRPFERGSNYFFFVCVCVIFFKVSKKSTNFHF